MAPNGNRTEDGTVAADGDGVAQDRRGPQRGWIGRRGTERAAKAVGVEGEVRSGTTAEQRTREVWHEQTAADATVWCDRQPIEQKIDTGDRAGNSGPAVRVLPVGNSVKEDRENRVGQEGAGPSAHPRGNRVVARQFSQIAADVIADVGFRSAPSAMRADGHLTLGREGGSDGRANERRGRERHPAAWRHVLQRAGATLDRRTIADQDTILHPAERPDPDIVPQYRKAWAGTDVSAIVAATKAGKGENGQIPPRLA